MKHSRVLFYCQHLLGVGHLSRSLALCQAFLQADMEVFFLQGGPDIGKTLEHSRFHKIQLAPLLMAEATNELYDPDHKLSIEEIFKLRAKQVQSLCESTNFDLVITELFPFGRNKFKSEVLTLLNLCKIKNSKCLSASSVRDILVEKTNSTKRNQETIDFVQKYYDLVLVHSDEKVIRFAETFPLANQIENQIIYTGFVSESGRKASLPRTNKILVSFGGGVVGDELAIAVANIAPALADFKFRFICGPYTPERVTSHLQKLSSANIQIESFLKDFEKQLAQSALSISLAGYNTVMNILATQTPSLVLPYDANHEQRLRAERLQALDQMKVLSQNDLEPQNLKKIILQWAHKKIPDYNINIDGAQTAAAELKKRLSLNGNHR
jgi:predicted glycosyltransferase